MHDGEGIEKPGVEGSEWREGSGEPISVSQRSLWAAVWKKDGWSIGLEVRSQSGNTVLSRQDPSGGD